MRKRLPHRIDVQSYTVTTTATGDRSGKTWTTLQTVWGDMKPLSGFQGNIAGRSMTEVSHVCDMYYYATTPLKSRDRLVKDSENYSITWVEEIDGLTRSLRVFCKRVDP
jgi:SPP1 family predicted phage head-tail adaptor